MSCSSAPIERSVSLRVYAGSGVASSVAYEYAASAAAFYAEHQLDLRLSLEAPVALEYALVGSQQDFSQALLAANLPIDEDLTPEQLAQARFVMGRVMLSALLPVLAAPGADGLTLLVTPEIVSPSLKEFFGLDSDLFGLGFPPATVASEAAAVAETGLEPFLAAANLERGIALLSESRLRSLAHGRENVVAHELGHALGLAHRIDAGNLMNPQVELGCRPCLQPSQAEAIAAHW